MLEQVEQTKLSAGGGQWRPRQSLPCPFKNTNMRSLKAR